MALITPTSSFQALFDRVATLEQMVTSPDVIPSGGSTGSFESITLTPPGGGPAVVLDATIPGVPTGLTAAAGAFQEKSYADLSWTAPASPPAYSYQVEVARKDVTAGTYAISEVRQTVGTSMRVEGLDAGVVYGYRVAGLSRAGTIGSFSARFDFTATLDSTAPPAVTGLTVLRGAASVIATWSASTADDVKNGHGIYQVELSIDNFATVLTSARQGGTVMVFGNQTTQQTYFVRVAAIDSSGNQGPYSTIVSTTAGGITSTMILADAIGPTQLAAGSVTAAKVAFSVGGGNLLKNSGFESQAGVLANWDATIVSSVTPGRSGAGTAVRLATATAQYAQQTLVLPPGSYVFTAWLRANALTTNGYGIQVSGGTSTNTLAAASNLTTGWVRHTAYVTTTAATTTVYFQIVTTSNAGAAGTLDVDDVQVEAGTLATSYAPKPDEILPGTVGTAEIAANAVTAAKITANTITAAQIAADTITANEIAANAITATELNANAVTAGKIAANAITATNIQSGAITTDKLTVAQTGDNKIINGDFEGTTYVQNGQTVPESWGANDAFTAGSAIGRSTGANGVGYSAWLLPASGGASVALISKGFPVLANQTYTWSARYLTEAAKAAGLYVQAFVVPSAGLYTTTGNIEIFQLVFNAGGSAGVWNYADGKFTTTTNGYLIIRLYTEDPSVGVAVRFDEIYVRPVERSVTIADGSISAVNITSGTITADLIGAGQITTNLMTANSINGDRISGNTLDVAKIITSTLAAKTITIGAGGQLQVGTNPGAGTTGLIFNSQGISLYNASARTVFLDAATGAATFTGTVSGSTITGSVYQTASAGARIVIATTLGAYGSDSVANLFFLSSRSGAGDYNAGRIFAYNNNSTSTGLVIQSGTASAGSDYPPNIILLSGSTVQNSQVNIGAGSVNVSGSFGVQPGLGTSGIGPYGIYSTGNGTNTLAIQAVSGFIEASVYQNGDWGNRGFRSTGTGGGVAAGYGFYVPSYSSACSITWRPDIPALIAYNSNDSSGVPFWASSHVVFSSAALKSEIVPMDVGVDTLRKLSPKRFKFNTVEGRKGVKSDNQYGLIAEEVAAIFPAAVRPDEHGKPLGISLDQLIALLVKVCQEHDESMSLLSTRFDELKALVNKK